MQVLRLVGWSILGLGCALAPAVEQTLMGWRGVPKLADPKRLPQSR